MPKKIASECGAGNSSETVSAGKKALFIATFAMLCVAIIVLVEIGLRVAGYGIDTRAFIKPPDKSDVYITNANLFKKYYPRRALTKPYPIGEMLNGNIFPVKKKEDTLRGFVVGGSTAQGYPYERNQSFSKITELALAAGDKYDNVELINFGLSAITSYCVRDIASKLFRYQPDFLVIYAGHNEYYGTISTTTGGCHAAKNLYLALNEFRIFQFLFNLQNIFDPPEAYGSLMEEQLGQHRRPMAPETDEEVATNFIKNIDAIVKSCQKRNIPVIIMEPVCNLIDMPPFSGEKDDEFKDYILSYAAAINNNRQVLETFYQDRLTRKSNDCNANIRYLDALARQKLTGKTDLNDFIAAKELDTLPFRAKEIIPEKLRAYCHNHSAANPNLFFIPLGQIFTQTGDKTAFNSHFFVDHLHFTQAGQRLVSQALAEQIADIFKFNEDEKGRVVKFYKNDGRIDKAIHYLPACRTVVFQRIDALSKKPPYNKMLIPYQHNNVDGLTEADVSPQLVKLITKAESAKMAPSVIIASFLINHGKIAEGKKYLDLYLWNYPDNYRPYLILARFQKTFNKDIVDTFATYKMAYLLSGKMKMIYSELDAFLASHGRKDLFEEIKKYGAPVE